MVLMTMVIMQLSTNRTSAVSPFPMVKFVAFVKLSMEKFAISNWKFNATKVCI